MLPLKTHGDAHKEGQRISYSRMKVSLSRQRIAGMKQQGFDSSNKSVQRELQCWRRHAARLAELTSDNLKPVIGDDNWPTNTWPLGSLRIQIVENHEK